MDKEAKLVATIAAKSPIAFETAMDDLGDSKESTPSSYILDQPEPPQEPDEEQPEEEPQEQPEEPQEESEEPQEEESEDLADISNAALAAKVLAEQRPDLFDNIDENMGWEDLIGRIDDYIVQSAETTKNLIEQNLGQAKQYVDFLLEGGSLESLQNAMTYADMTNVNLDQADEQTLEAVYRSDLEHRNVNDDDIEQLIDVAKSRNMLKQKAISAQQSLKEREKSILEAEKINLQKQKEQMELERQKISQQINKIIDAPSILGYDLNDDTRKRLREMIFERNVVVNVEENGKIVPKEITRFAQLKNEFDKNIEQQIAFALLLDNGFDLSDMTRAKKNESKLMKELRKRESKKLPKVRSGYFQ